MKFLDTLIPDVKIVAPTVLEDSRGFFFESFNRQKFQSGVGRDVDFVQDNHSRSAYGVLRGLHYQLPPHAQGKLVRVAVGEIFDVAIDIRKSSKTFGKWVGLRLSAENKLQLWIPEGFAHGFVTLSEHAEVLYKTTSYYAPRSDRGILWNDPALGIDWQGLSEPLLSQKDAAQPLLSDAEVFD